MYSLSVDSQHRPILQRSKRGSVLLATRESVGETIRRCLSQWKTALKRAKCDSDQQKAIVSIDTATGRAVVWLHNSGIAFACVGALG
jgi:hypothetical protein